MMRILILLPLLPTLVLSQGVLSRVGKTPQILKESSGLEITGDNELWTHNDDTQAILYCLDTLGTIKRVIHLNHKNKEWEDLARDNKGNMYVGGFGNNNNNRTDLKIYKIPNPHSTDEMIISAEIIEFQYADQKAFPPEKKDMNFDMEAMICFEDSIYLFSKNRTQPYTGYCKMYRLPQTQGKHVAELVDSVYLGPGDAMETWVTAADISPQGSKLALLSHDKIFLFTGFEGDDFFKGKLTVIPLNDFSQKEALCFMDENIIYLTDEVSFNILGGYIYKVDLTKQQE